MAFDWQSRSGLWELLLAALLIGQAGCNAYDVTLKHGPGAEGGGPPDAGSMAGAAATGASGHGGDASAMDSGTNAGASGAGSGGGAGDAGDGPDSGSDASVDAASDASQDDAGACIPDAGVDCCPSDDDKTEPGECGCGVAETDIDTDDVTDCVDPSLGFQKAITFDGAQVGSELSGFVVLVRLTDADLEARAASDGSDILFLDGDSSTPLAHEIERYDAQTGTLIAWVLVPTLAAGTDTLIYLRYGDGGPNRSNPQQVFAGYHYVWHLAQDPGPGGASEIRDSTGRAHGSAHASMDSSDYIDAVIGKGIDFDGTDDEVTFVSDVSGGGSSTISAWVNQANDTDGSSDVVLSVGNGMNNQSRFLVAAHGTTNNVVGGFYTNDLDTGHSIEAAGFRHLAWVFDGSQSSFYVDGVLESGPSAHTGASTSGAAGKIGNATWAARPLRGQLDEVRVALATRSAAWLAAEHENQRPGSTFIKAVGAEQAVTAP